MGCRSRGESRRHSVPSFHAFTPFAAFHPFPRSPAPLFPQVLPNDIREPLVSHPQRASLLEVVLDLGRRPEARFLGQSGGQFLREAEVGTWVAGWLGGCLGHT